MQAVERRDLKWLDIAEAVVHPVDSSLLSSFQVMFLRRPRRPFANFACHDPCQALHTHPRAARLRKFYCPYYVAM